MAVFPVSNGNKNSGALNWFWQVLALGHTGVRTFSQELRQSGVD